MAEDATELESPDRPVRAEDGKQRSGGVQSIERAFRILEVLAGNGGVMGLSALAAEAGTAAADHSPALPHAGRSRLPAAGAVPAVRAGPAHPAARRELVDDAERRRPPASRPAGRRARRDRQPGVAGRRSDRLHLAGAVPAFDADVHRGRPPGVAALHGRRQGDHGRHAARRGAGTVAAHRHAAAHRAHHHRPGDLRRAAGAGPPNTATPSTTASRNSASGASPSRFPASGRSWRCRCPGRPAG